MLQEMFLKAKLLSSIKQSVTLVSCSYPSIFRPSQSLYGNLASIRNRIKNADLVSHNCVSRIQYELNIQRNYIKNLGLLGSKNVWKTFGVSVILGSSNFRSRIAYSMDDIGISRDDYDRGSQIKEEAQAFWTLTKKFWLPVLLLVTVLLDWDHPIRLVTKVIVFLLSTKPTPLSVYISIDQLCDQLMRQEPYLYKLKTLYANKVEVHDCRLLRIARVEVGDKKFMLLGILGCWYTLSSS